MAPPPAPTVDDWDSDESAVVPGTQRRAGKSAPPTKHLMHMHNSGRADAASDSGYSSHASNTVASSTGSHPGANLQHARGNSQPVVPLPNQATIGRRDSQRGSQRPSRSSSVSVCTNPNCGDPKCASKKDLDLRYTLPHRPPPQRVQTTQFPVQDLALPIPPTQAPGYQYPQHPAGQPTSQYYNPSTDPRPRAPSTSRARPTSWAPGAYPYGTNYQQGVPIPQGNYNPQAHGPPPSPSAYNRNSYIAHHPTMNAEWQGMPPPMISGSPRDSFGTYLPGHGLPMPSSGQAYPPALTYSARQPATPGREIATPATANRSSNQPTISARRGSIMPGSFPGEGIAFGSSSGSGSESASSGSESEDDTQQRHHEQLRRRELERARAQRKLENKKLEDRMAMPPPPREREHERERPRRPTLTHTRTTPVESRHRSREAPRRALYSEPDMSSSEYVDSDRTPRPSASKRLTYSNSREMRKPSISHHEPSGRDRSSSHSYSPAPAPQYVVEDANGHKQYYNTREEAMYKASRLNQQQRLDDAEAYQATKRGASHSSSVTMDDVKRATKHQPERKPPSSHVSGSSKKSTSSSRMSMSESTIQIRRGDAVYTIPADRTVEITTKEGETMLIGPGSPPREKSYYGSSASTRTGRSRNGSDFGGRRRDTITEEDGYERAL